MDINAMPVSRLVLWVFFLASGLSAVSCGGKALSPAAPALVPAPSPLASPVTDVSAVYASRCALCHGDKRQGRYGSGGALTPDTLAEKNDETVRETISGGIAYTAMPAFGRILSPEETEALVRFIKYTSP